jgi:4-aminobutyrate aminotransferase-like enzyme
VKFLPPLTIDEDTLNKGLDILEIAIEDVIYEKKERLTKEF